ncbi:MAG TPA: hypothetical protein VNC84_00435 [Gammaproteobacteria bacterium]|jgi:hypothetical protein|nr:hypothetical protein [Gammaproteobacteria bacterium]
MSRSNPRAALSNVAASHAELAAFKIKLKENIDAYQALLQSCNLLDGDAHNLLRVARQLLNNLDLVYLNAQLNHQGSQIESCVDNLIGLLNAASVQLYVLYQDSGDWQLHDDLYCMHSEALSVNNEKLNAGIASLDIKNTGFRYLNEGMNSVFCFNIASHQKAENDFHQAIDVALRTLMSTATPKPEKSTAKMQLMKRIAIGATLCFLASAIILSFGVAGVSTVGMTALLMPAIIAVAAASSLMLLSGFVAVYLNKKIEQHDAKSLKENSRKERIQTDFIKLMNTVKDMLNDHGEKNRLSSSQLFSPSFSRCARNPIRNSLSTH